MSEVSNGRGGWVDPAEVPSVAVGTMVSLDLDASRKFYEEFLGLECVRYAPGRMLIRDKACKDAMENGERTALIIDVQEVEAVEHPQNVMNHWGLTVDSEAEVDRIYAAANEMKDVYGLRMKRITNMHGAYGFYMMDRDTNWWEIEFRSHGRTNEMVFEDGDAELPQEKA